MIRFIIVIALFFSVLALSPLLIDEKGYILIAMGETIIELTVLSAIIILTLFCIGAFILVKLLRGGFKVWINVTFTRRRHGIANFNRGLASYILEDYQAAEQLFAKSAEPAKRQQSAYLLAAASSAKQALNTHTNHYLDLLAQETAKFKQSDLTSLVVRVKLLMNQASDDAYAKARVLIDKNHKQIGHDSRLLALEIDLCLIEKRFQTVINYLPAARKDKNITEVVIQAWEASAFYGAFTNIICQQDQTHLHEYWKSVPRKIKQRETVLFAYCHTLAENNITEPLTKLITPLLKKQPNANFFKQLRTLPIKQSEPLIALVQKHLHNNNSQSQNAQWFSCLGHLAVMSEQWTMAEKAFRSLINLEGKQYDKQDLCALATALTKDGQHKEANEVWLKLSAL